MMANISAVEARRAMQQIKYNPLVSLSVDQMYDLVLAVEGDPEKARLAAESLAQAQETAKARQGTPAEVAE